MRFFKRLLNKFIRLVAFRKAIIFESVPDFSDNTKAVFDEMLRRGLDKKYNLVWAVRGDEKLPLKNRHVKYIWPGKKKGWESLRTYFYTSTAKAMICCNRFLCPKEDQTAFYLTHGTPIKYVRDYYTVPEAIQYCLAAAPGVEKLTAEQFNVREDKMFSLGFPRNDVFAESHISLQPLLDTQCSKVIVWYPTFRQHQNGLEAGGQHALPIIHDTEAAVQLNQHAKEKNVLLVLKPHFAQDLSQIKDLHLSNIRFIDDGFFREKGVSSYEFVGSCDALITDYSSIYFDYMLCNKPIGLVWEDIAEYRENPGFAVDIDEYGKGGVQIYTLEDFRGFITEVSEEIDSCQTEREKICKQVNYAADGKNAQRVVNFISQKAML